MHRLIAAATGPPGVTVVTGMAGTGKSAVLARLVTLSDYGFRAQHPALIAAIPAHLQPPLGAVDAAVLATGELPHDVLVQLLETFSGTLPAANVSLTDLRSSWWRWLARHGEPVTIVVDALDEAPHPALLLTEVLARLNPDPAAPLVRLIVGVRSPGGPDETPTARPEPDGGAIAVLADLAERMLAATRLRVDEPPLCVGSGPDRLRPESTHSHSRIALRRRCHRRRRRDRFPGPSGGSHDRGTHGKVLPHYPDRRDIARPST